MAEIYSHQTGTAINRVFCKKPSELIPFKGEFPIVPEWRVEQFYEIEHSHNRLEECPEWFQQAIIKGCEIDTIDRGFHDWLQKRKIKQEDFLRMKVSDKSTELVRFLNENCLSIDRLNI